MTTACLFPGQGSQFVGMGKTLFPCFASIAEEASDLLGYSIAALCLEGPEQKIGLTQYTQPCIYVVSALSYLALREDEAIQPGFVAGHSLGEYGALFAAGCFEFAAGLTLVRERARLMGEVSGTSMTAITQVEATWLAELLDRDARFCNIDVANYNTPTQTVVSGDIAQLKLLAVEVEGHGGRAFPLKVSAAFHSRYMRPAQKSFADFVAGVGFLPPRIPVIANISAEPYPADSDAIRANLVGQIASPVRWSQTILALHQRGVERFVETQPGKVLTRMSESIVKDLPKQSALPPAAATRPAVSRPVADAAASAIFVCPGQGGHHFQMGRSLYAGNPAFRESFDACDELARPLIEESIAALVYRPADPRAEFSRTLHTHVASFAYGYSVARSLQAGGVRPVCYVAWSLGEYVALAASGALALKDAMALVAGQARQIEERTEPAAMLSVLDNVNIYYSMGRRFAECTLAGIHAQKCFTVTGSPAAVTALRDTLDGIGINCIRLPIRHGFHSSRMDAIEPLFRADCAKLARSSPTLPIYSAVQRGVVEAVDDDYLWRICRSRFNFRAALMLATEAYPNAGLHDVGPSWIAAGTTATSAPMRAAAS